MKNRLGTYLERYAWPYPLDVDYLPPTDLEIIIIIPSYREPDILPSLRSLLATTPLPVHTLLCVVVNEPEDASEATRKINRQTLKTIQQVKGTDKIDIIGTLCQLPPKKAGVGLARKIGMDQAARWFGTLDKDGIIVCFDADCTCPPNYLQSVFTFYQSSKHDAGIVFHEHPLHPQSGIIDYELHLRYYVDALRYARYPYAFLTLGSCITVKTNVYLKSGGMNTRKAGEDFYFLHKIAPSCSLGEINQTTVYPADRISDRVPFGTGRALMLYEKEKEIMTYPFQVFEDIKHLMESWQELFAGQMPVFPESVAAFMAEQEFESTLKKIRTESPNLASFHKRFFTWWDGFRMLKYIHFARDHYYPMARLSESLLSLNSALWHVDSFPSSATEQLKCIREWDRGYGNQTR